MLAPALGLATVIAAADLEIPAGYALGALYVVPVAVAVLSEVPNDPLWVALVSSIYTALDVQFGERGAPLAVALPNRGMSLVAIWVTAVLVFFARRAQISAAQARTKADVFLRTMVESAPDGMLVVDRDGVIRFANQTAADMFGWSVPELMDEPVERLLPVALAERHRQLRARFDQARARRRMGRVDGLMGLRKDGTEFPVDIGLSPLTLAGGEYLVIASIRDISERRAADQSSRH